uniref:Zinc finger and BTB domain containing 38 n=1 Tax=Oreochromis aureus TaxID=47969 RepID=A0A668S4H0_OREAU
MIHSLKYQSVLTVTKLNEQRLQGLFCDVTIVVEDVKFRAHKNILAACSGYFRNALTTSEPWNSSQVLELMDLKSEVFACILNFMYCSKVTSSDAEDTRGVVAAGKRLGIPFLEKLAEQERQDECVKPKAPLGLEEVDSTRGPRITNAFSITEVCPGNNPFTPLDQANGERQSPDLGQLPSSCSTTSCFSGNNETTHTLSEHSYAVCKSTEGKDSSQCDSKKVCNIDTGPPMATDNAPMELGPPTLSPQTEDSISIYGCEHCPEIFTNKALLTIHSEVHKKRFVSHLFCTFCHRKFIHLKRLRNHEQVDHHSDDGSEMETNTSQPPPTDLYNCSVCKRVYVTLSSLKRHENVHSWQRAYPCHYCNKVFALAEYRTKHEIWHTGERRYQCIFCLETFMTYYILKNHQKSFHGIDPTLGAVFLKVHEDCNQLQGRLRRKEKKKQFG